jgi:hypothetical protein
MKLAIIVFAFVMSLLVNSPASAWNIPTADLPADHTRLGAGLLYASLEHAWGDDWITSASVGIPGYSAGAMFNVTRTFIRTNALSLGLTAEAGLMIVPNGALSFNFSAAPIRYVQPALVTAWRPIAPMIVRGSLGPGVATGMPDGSAVAIVPMAALQLGFVLSPAIELELGFPHLLGVAGTW